jgi:hypothetical protein
VAASCSISLGRRHVGLAGQVFQGRRPPQVNQRAQQPPAHFDALDAARFALDRHRLACL